MNDPLSELTLCEDGAPRLRLTSRTVVFPNIWGKTEYARRILALERKLSVKSISVGLTEEGVAVRFRTKKEAALMRLFYEGETRSK